MNILYVTFTSRLGGATTALLHLATGMIDKGHNVFVLTKNDGPLVVDLSRTGAGVFFAPISLTVYASRGSFIRRQVHTIIRFWGWWKTRKIIGKIIEENNIDIVHTNVGPLDIALKECQKRKIPHFWHQREFFDLFGNAVFFPSNQAFYKRIHSAGNYNICITNEVRKHCKLKNEDNNSSVIYDGVFALSECLKDKDLKKEKYILFVGRVENNKAPDEIISAFCSFHKQHPDYRLTIAGAYEPESKYYQHCLEIIKSNSIGDYVDFLGNRNDIYELMEHASAVVVCSHFEGFGFITAEAMLNKTVVIGKNTSGTKEQFDIGLQLTGKEIAYRYNTIEELIDCLNASVTKNNEEMIENAHHVVSTIYTIEKCVDETEAFYLRVVDNNI